MRTGTALKGVRQAVLDTMVFIYLFEDDPVYGAPCERLLKEAAVGVFSGIVTPITMAEILVKPLKNKRSDIADRYRQALRNLPNVQPCVFNLETGMMAGALRAQYGFPLPDAMQAAAALQGGGVLVTNDRALKRIKEVRVILLSDLVV